MGELRHGFTTGSCAAAAAKAAAIMLFTGFPKESIFIETPKGIVFNAKIVDIDMSHDSVICGVVKDGGDDPDVTTGLTILARVSLASDFLETERIIISGGEGVGLVTKPGLDQKIGNHAINSVPREMIRREVEDVLDAFDYEGAVQVVISCPGGEEVAKKTFNPRLGIEGGISIIGTSGIVEPMSQEALTETIRVELKQKRALGYEIISISPGNYGLDFMAEAYGFDLDRSVKCSNFIGLTCDMVKDLGYKKMLLVGHAGKLVKIGAGIMNTHSREADGRMETIAAAFIKEGGDRDGAIRILESNTTDEAFNYLKDIGMMERVADRIVEQIIFHLNKRLGDKVEVQCVMFTREIGLLGRSPGSNALIDEIKKLEDMKEERND